MARRLALTLLILAVAVAAWPMADGHAQQIERSLVPKFQEADALLRDGEYERAAALFEALVNDSPETYVFFERLLRAYENMKWYDEAIARIAERGEYAGNVSLMAEKGRLLYLDGQEQPALQMWEQTIEADPQNEQTYRTVYRAMTDVRHMTGAADVLEEGRERLGDADAFRFELANLYGVTGQHDRAAAEYVQVIASDERRLSFVRNRLSRLFEQDGALEAAIPVVEAAVEDEPLYQPFRELLGWLYLEGEHFEQALDAYRAIDRLEGSNGRQLLSFASAAIDGSAYAAALTAYQEVIDRYEDSGAALRAQLGLAATFEHWGDELSEMSAAPRASLEEQMQPDESENASEDQAEEMTAEHAYRRALKGYESFLDSEPGHQQEATVLERIGRLHLEVTRDFDAAEAAFRQLLEDHSQAEEAPRAAFNMGRVALKRGDLERARVFFSRVIDERRTGELVDEARYELALLHFYRGEFEASETLLSAVRSNTTSDVANDAIELRLLILDGQGPDSLHTALRTLATSQLLQRQHHHEAALSRLDTLLAQHASHSVAPAAWMARTESLQALGSVAEAVDQLLELPERFPRSTLADKALFRAASILEHQIGDEAAALDTYIQLIESFPGSVRVSDARERIRILRGRGIEQEA